MLEFYRWHKGEELLDEQDFDCVIIYSEDGYRLRCVGRCVWALAPSDNPKEKKIAPYWYGRSTRFGGAILTSSIIAYLPIELPEEDGIAELLKQMEAFNARS